MVEVHQKVVSCDSFAASKHTPKTGLTHPLWKGHTAWEREGVGGNKMGISWDPHTLSSNFT